MPRVDRLARRWSLTRMMHALETQIFFAWFPDAHQLCLPCTSTIHEGPIQPLGYPRMARHTTVLISLQIPREWAAIVNTRVCFPTLMPATPMTIIKLLLYNLNGLSNCQSCPVKPRSRNAAESSFDLAKTSWTSVDFGWLTGIVTLKVKCKASIPSYWCHCNRLVHVPAHKAIEHKGGRLAVAWKHKGDPAGCSSHRSLLVSSHLGKTIHRALRQKYHHLYTGYMQAQQVGGRPKMPVGIPLLMTRKFMSWQQRLKKPVSVILLDLTEAFYRVVRCLALGGDLSDANLGFDSDTLHVFHQQIQDPSALQEAGAPPFVQPFMQALHKYTWHTIGDQVGLVRTDQGSRPGHSYADVVFGLQWAKFLRKYQDKLVAAEVLTSIPQYEHPTLFTAPMDLVATVPLLGPMWMDDLSVCVCASSNRFSPEPVDWFLPWVAHTTELEMWQNRNHALFPRIRIQSPAKAVLFPTRWISSSLWACLIQSFGCQALSPFGWLDRSSCCDECSWSYQTCGWYRLRRAYSELHPRSRSSCLVSSRWNRICTRDGSRRIFHMAHPLVVMMQVTIALRVSSGTLPCGRFEHVYRPC